MKVYFFLRNFIIRNNGVGGLDRPFAAWGRVIPSIYKTSRYGSRAYRHFKRGVIAVNISEFAAAGRKPIVKPVAGVCFCDYIYRIPKPVLTVALTNVSARFRYYVKRE